MTEHPDDDRFNTCITGCHERGHGDVTFSQRQKGAGTRGTERGKSAEVAGGELIKNLIEWIMYFNRETIFIGNKLESTGGETGS